MLFTTPDLDDADRRVLGEIDGYYRDLERATGGARARERRWEGRLRSQLVAGAIQGSNSIEGYTVSLSAASAIVTGASIPADVPESTREAVLGYRDALTWSLHASAADYFTYSEMLLSTLHYMMVRHQPDKRPGRYRTGGVIVTGDDPLTPAYTGPDAAHVPGLMRELVEWLNQTDPDSPPLVRAAMAHLHLVMIHPWRDGNGRMSRCLQTLAIARGGTIAPEFCSIEEWLGRDINTLDYYRTLRQTGAGSYHPERSAHEWVRFNLRAHHLQAQVVTRRLKLAERTWGAMADLARRLGLHERVITALHTAAVDFLRRETYQRDEGLSRDQAVRDIRRLERAGLVQTVGYGQILHYVAAGEAREIFDAIVEELRGATTEPYQS
jgi:Fic family protein